MLELEICYANVELKPEQTARLCGISQKDGFACAFMDCRHEAGAALQVAGPHALCVFVNPKASAIGKAKSNDNRVAAR